MMKALLYFCATACLICFLNANPAVAQELRDGEEFSVHGVLHLVHRGYSAYLVLETKQHYVAVFQPDERRQVHSIEILLSGQGKELIKHSGEEISAEGTLVLEPNLPYYYNGVALQATRIHLAGNKVPTASEAPVQSIPFSLPAGMTSYFAQVTFKPGPASYTYLAWSREGKLLDGAENSLTCSLNGSGELLNCFCRPDGVEVTQTGRMQDGHFVQDEHAEIPDSGSEAKMPGFAQFSLPERIPRTIQRAVLCTQMPSKP